MESIPWTPISWIKIVGKIGSRSQELKTNFLLSIGPNYILGIRHTSLIFDKDAPQQKEESMKLPAGVPNLNQWASMLADS